MTVRVRFQLRRRRGSRPGPASALFVPGRDAAALLSVCTRLGLDPSGRVHDVAGGFLLKLDRPASEPLPGATRLRESSPELYVPVDAELVPSLLDDEAAGMVRDGGLVCLPGGPVLRFDRTAPVGMPALLAAESRPRRDWRPLPDPPELADRLVEVSREWPEPPPEELYREWEQDLRRPGSSRPGGQPPPDQARGDAEGEDAEDAADLAEDAEGAEGGAASGVRSGLHGLGEAMRNLAGRAGSGARSLGEKLRWGMLDHSALVQKLLREFRQGDAERALRHAFSMAPADARHRWVRWGNRLPFSRAVYNLFDLLGGSSRGGPVSVWQSRPDLLEELKREYRKAADRAIRLGDFRRAAYIHGKLLGDDRMAAQALQRGGLHHDAAILYLKKLGDRLAAAQAFEAAGLVDRALAIHRELGLHEAAGDLLRRIGDEPAALEEFLLAAARAREATPEDWLEAGRILSRKAGRTDLAAEVYRTGWDRRPAANAIPCALELVAIHAPRGEIEPLRQLLDEGDTFFRSQGSDRDAESFYNRMIAAVTAVPHLSPFAEEVHDRARSALAGMLHRQILAGKPPSLAVASSFSHAPHWTPSFVRDARFAATAAADRLRDRDPKSDRHPRSPGIQVGRGTVTAACQASASAEVFLGFADGKILAFRPGRNQVVPIGEVAGGVASMAVSPSGRVLAVLRHTEHGSGLTTYLRREDGTFGARPEARFARSRTWLTPILELDPEVFVGLGCDGDLRIIDAAALLPIAHISIGLDPLSGVKEPASAALLLPLGESFRVLVCNGLSWFLLDQAGDQLGSSPSAWWPVGGSRAARCSVPPAWLCLEGLVKIVGLDQYGTAHSSQLLVEEDVLEVVSSPVATTDGGYLAVTPKAPSQVVAVSASRIDWLIEGSGRFQTYYSLPDPGLAATVACFPSSDPEEVLVVSAEGFVSRIAVPRRSRRHRATS